MIANEVKPIKKVEYTCPECEQVWMYSELEMKYAKGDKSCHECTQGAEDYPANDGGMV